MTLVATHKSSPSFLTSPKPGGVDVIAQYVLWLSIRGIIGMEALMENDQHTEYLRAHALYEAFFLTKRNLVSVHREATQPEHTVLEKH